MVKDVISELCLCIPTLLVILERQNEALELYGSVMNILNSF